MASDMRVVKGTRFQYSTDNGSTYTTLTDMVDIGSPAMAKSPKVDKTPLDPTGGHEYTPGLPDYGEQDFKQMWNHARQAALMALYLQTILWRILYPDAALDANKSHDDFTGYICDLGKEPMSSVDGRLIIVGKVQLTGQPTFTQGTP